jgi:hypothetical protein
MYRNLWTRDEAVHNVQSRVGMKVEPVPKLRERELRLSSPVLRRLNEEKGYLVLNRLFLSQ